MSIYGSMSAPDDSDHEDGCAIYVEDPPGSGCYEFSGKPCDCGQPDAPLVYQGSHVLPSDTDKRGGVVDIAFIASHVTRDGRDDRPEDETPWPYLRLGVNEGIVVLTVRNVQQIHASLTEWLDAVGARDTTQSNKRNP